MRISDWSSDVCSSDLAHGLGSLDDMAVNLVHGCLYVARYKRGGDDAQRDDGGKQPAGISQKDVRQGDGCGQDDDGWWGSQAVYCQPQGSGSIGRASCRERECQYGSILGVAVS